ncbi:hypothetical protein A3B21_04550 [Candidatus Uhrbacteria bacterium RIFCSPLOWO2_01_FULL_47_24]|uniref:Uncharacterized protein n=1 Tax=Candidatus Uhrbacteria bacterium RIFCSPLOWO2_01_FULL_47_24 TaxID=1802401 RepID=A0A1F7UTP6_9BACT|nr:MAG: hypothetical protein A3D58_00310 [Candidatus Uhrbacteria bacterium RIFCSPHIGHO2_02_FULL_46_47]OGL81690.1 MAG: hypothetical protein A3B21_04550 [Candidatus Uhrbacteria bacterium RIFCSPLOWO2_01_FULL_47_24]OGL85057.1 MAG: hypothetical protein A3J03_03770 [Candidatus Uhrbacteria bacterium RIFCSPLOWO2_02_FULL_46_25]OGL93134.1 MAG: hypothetical protein A3H11_00165 [Candidatus Uhrbacteria bacterium RIFCSPLOWO2_12_FULL_47_10]
MRVPQTRSPKGKGMRGAKRGGREMKTFFFSMILGLIIIGCGGGDDDSSSNEGESEAEGEDNVCVVGTRSTCESQSQCAQFDHCGKLLPKEDLNDKWDASDYDSYYACMEAEEYSPCTLRCGDGRTYPGQWTLPDGVGGDCHCYFLEDNNFDYPEELCNGLDDDCDGEVDYGQTDGDHWRPGGSCDGNDDDSCEEGEYVCSADGIGVVCTDETDTIPELCNGLDDDCDEQVDDGFWDYPYGLDGNCDGDDDDLCEGGVYVCDSSGTGTVCSDTDENTPLEEKLKKYQDSCYYF